MNGDRIDFSSGGINELFMRLLLLLSFTIHPFENNGNIWKMLSRRALTSTSHYHTVEYLCALDQFLQLSLIVMFIYIVDKGQPHLI